MNLKFYEVILLDFPKLFFLGVTRRDPYQPFRYKDFIHIIRSLGSRVLAFKKEKSVGQGTQGQEMQI